MTNYDYYSKTADRLESLLDLAVADALRAKGCSMRLKLPGDYFTGGWERWLESEFIEELREEPLISETPQNMTAEQYNAQAVTDRLEEIISLISRVNTPFAQALRDIIEEAAENVRLLTG